MQSPLIEAKDLIPLVTAKQVKVVDASWYLPSEQRYPLAEFENGHIPGAVFFDIDTICDRDSAFPHMLPNTPMFEAAIGELGISNDDEVVVYDGSGIFSAPRVWWMLRIFGHDKVRVLNGGLPAWIAAGGEMANLHQDGRLEYAAQNFRSSFRPHLVTDIATVWQSLKDSTIQVIDARAAPRFSGEQPEPRPGVRCGHMPGSINLPFKSLLDNKGRMLSARSLKSRFETAGVDFSKPLVTSCGSGVTACVLALGLYCLGHENVTVYDGSWSEWGSCEEYPVESAS